MRHWRWYLAIALGVLVGGALLASLTLRQATPSKSSVGHVARIDQEPLRLEAFVWLESIGVKDEFAKLVWVDHVSTRNYGFLVSSSPTRIVYLWLDLSPITIDLDDDGTGASSGKADVLEALRDGQKRDEQLATSFTASYVEGNSEDIVQPVILSMLADAHGDPELSKKFFGYALAFARGRSLPFIDGLKEDVGFRLFHGIVEAIFNREESWATIRARLDVFLEHFPSHGLAERAKAYASALDRMAIQEREHGAAPSADEIDQLVYDLRNDVGDVFYVPHPSPPRKGLSARPGERILALGRRAVPKLIDALTDPSLTHESADAELVMAELPVQPVQRVGDVALRLLRQITFQYLGDSPYDEPEWLDKMTAIQRKVNAWWKQNKRMSDFQAVSKAVLDGDITRTASEVLARRYPKQAPEVLQRALAKTSSGVERQSMIEALGLCPGSKALAQLRKVMAKGQVLEMRLTAAEALWPRHPEEALHAMIGEWNRLVARGKENEDDADNLRGFLVSTGRDEALDALRGGL